MDKKVHYLILFWEYRIMPLQELKHLIQIDSMQCGHFLENFLHFEIVFLIANIKKGV